MSGAAGPPSIIWCTFFLKKMSAVGVGGRGLRNEGVPTHGPCLLASALRLAEVSWALE